MTDKSTWEQLTAVLDEHGKICHWVHDYATKLMDDGGPCWDGTMRFFETLGLPQWDSSDETERVLTGEFPELTPSGWLGREEALYTEAGMVKMLRFASQMLRVYKDEVLSEAMSAGYDDGHCTWNDIILLCEILGVDVPEREIEIEGTVTITFNFVHRTTDPDTKAVIESVKGEIEQKITDALEIGTGESPYGLRKRDLDVDLSGEEG